MYPRLIKSAAVLAAVSLCAALYIVIWQLIMVASPPDRQSGFC